GEGAGERAERENQCGSDARRRPMAKVPARSPQCNVGARPVTWRPDRADEGPQPVGASLNRLARTMGMAEPGSLRGVFGRWAEVVGEPIAAHARPVSL